MVTRRRRLVGRPKFEKMGVTSWHIQTLPHQIPSTFGQVFPHSHYNLVGDRPTWILTEVNHSSTLSATCCSMLNNGMCRGPSSLRHHPEKKNPIMCLQKNYTYRLTYILLTSQFIYLPLRYQYPTWLWPICLPTRSGFAKLALS